MRIVAGCDGGGTKCAVRVAMIDAANSTIAEADGISGGANVCTDMAVAIQNVAQAIHDAFRKLDLPPETEINHFVAAFAGSTRVSHEALKQHLRDQLRIEQLSIVPDVAVLFAAAEVTPPALATIVGTGSIAWLTTTSDKTFRAGGDGPPDGDLGSGFWIGREAMKRNLLAPDSIAASLKESNQSPAPREYANLASQVFAMVESQQAQEILSEAAEHIAGLIVDAVRQSGASPNQSLTWVSAGGVAVHQPKWLASVRDLCKSEGVSLKEPRLVPHPVSGALRLAIEESTLDR